MRNVIWIAALLVGAVVAESASAQSFGMTSRSPTRTNKIGLWGTSSLLSSPFRLTNLFGSFHNVLMPGTSNTGTRVNPNDPNYLKAFGYKRLH